MFQKEIILFFRSLSFTTSLWVWFYKKNDFEAQEYVKRHSWSLRIGLDDLLKFSPNTSDPKSV